jgi:hypothetical protein
MLTDISIPVFYANRLENVENTGKNIIYSVRYIMAFTAPIFTRPLNTAQPCVENFQTRSRQIYSRNIEITRINSCKSSRKVWLPQRLLSRNSPFLDSLFLKIFYTEFHESPENGIVANTTSQMDGRTNGHDFHIKRSFSSKERLKTEALRK